MGDTVHPKTRLLWDMLKDKTKSDKNIELHFNGNRGAIVQEIMKVDAEGNNVLHLAAINGRGEELIRFFISKEAKLQVQRNSLKRYPWELATVSEFMKNSFVEYISHGGQIEHVKCVLANAKNGEWSRVLDAITDDRMMPRDFDTCVDDQSGCSLLGYAIDAENDVGTNCSALKPSEKVALTNVLLYCNNMGATLNASDLLGFISKGGMMPAVREYARNALPRVDLITVDPRVATQWMLVAAAVHDVNAAITLGNIAHDPWATTGRTFKMTGGETAGWNVLTLLLAGHGESQTKSPAPPPLLARDQWPCGPALLPDDIVALKEFLLEKLSVTEPGVTSGSTSIAKLVSIRDPITRSTPLHLASRMQAWAVVEALLLLGAEVDAREDKDCRPTPNVGPMLELHGDMGPCPPRTAIEIAAHELLRTVNITTTFSGEQDTKGAHWFIDKAEPYVHDMSGIMQSGLLTLHVLLSEGAHPSRSEAGRWGAFPVAVQTSLPSIVSIFSLYEAPAKIDKNACVDALETVVRAMAWDSLVEHSFLRPEGAAISPDGEAQPKAAYRTLQERIPSFLVMRTLLSACRTWKGMCDALSESRPLTLACEFQCPEAVRMLRAAKAAEAGPTLRQNIQQSWDECLKKQVKAETKGNDRNAFMFRIKAKRCEAVAYELDHVKPNSIPNVACERLDGKGEAGHMGQPGMKAEAVLALLGRLRDRFRLGMRPMRAVMMGVVRHDSWWFFQSGLQNQDRPDLMYHPESAVAWAHALGVHLSRDSRVQLDEEKLVRRAGRCWCCRKDARDETSRVCRKCLLARFCSGECFRSAEKEHNATCRSLGAVLFDCMCKLKKSLEARRERASLAVKRAAEEAAAHKARLEAEEAARIAAVDAEKARVAAEAAARAVAAAAERARAREVRARMTAEDLKVKREERERRKKEEEAKEKEATTENARALAIAEGLRIKAEEDEDEAYTIDILREEEARILAKAAAAEARRVKDKKDMDRAALKADVELQQKRADAGRVIVDAQGIRRRATDMYDAEMQAELASWGMTRGDDFIGKGGTLTTAWGELKSMSGDEMTTRASLAMTGLDRSTVTFDDNLGLGDLANMAEWSGEDGGMGGLEDEEEAIHRADTKPTFAMAAVAAVSSAKGVPVKGQGGVAGKVSVSTLFGTSAPTSFPQAGGAGATRSAGSVARPPVAISVQSLFGVPSSVSSAPAPQIDATRPWGDLALEMSGEYAEMSAPPQLSKREKNVRLSLDMTREAGIDRPRQRVAFAEMDEVRIIKEMQNPEDDDEVLNPEDEN